MFEKETRGTRAYKQGEVAGLRKGGREGEVGHNRENKGAKISALFGG